MKMKYMEWNVGAVFLLKSRGNYAYRITLKYEDGESRIIQRSGFISKKEAECNRKETMGALASGTFVENDSYRVADFLTLWLEDDIKQRVDSHETYETYRNAVEKHIIPVIGQKKLSELHKGDISRLYRNRAEYSVSCTRLVKTVMNVSLDYAVSRGLLTHNPATGVNMPKGVTKQPYHTQNYDSQKTLSMEQIQILIEKSKGTKIYMQVLFNVLMGLRRGEINGVKYSDVDELNRTLTIKRQLGVQMGTVKEDLHPKTYTKQEIGLKTYSSYRTLPIPDLVFEAIQEQRKIYEKNRSRRGKYFMDYDYICCSSYGRPRSKNYHWTHYKKLLREADLPDIRWHDLRSTYCTLLLREGFSPKAISNLMGHSKELITMDVYGDNRNIIAGEIPELEDYIDEVIPKSGQEEDISGIEIDVSEFLE